jgi:glycosyltransferase involved in cell wall biosynthesis
MPQNKDAQNEDAPLFTVFTPTFNRADTLHRVFDSLEAQTFRDFEWLIIDDGSSDQTRSLVEHWQRTAGFAIRYYWQPNQGKHVAFNHGVRQAYGTLFLTIDSDDSCFPNALERFAFHWNSIAEVQQCHFCGVLALCVDERGNVIGSKFPRDIMNGGFAELIYKYKVRGEKWGVFRTEVLKEFPFPFTDWSGYIPEGIVWRQIEKQYIWRFINEPLRVYFEGQAGRPDQLTRASIDRIALGGFVENQSSLNEQIRWFCYSPIDFLRSAALYSRFAFHLQIGLQAQISGLHNPLARLLWIFGLSAGYLFFLNKKHSTPL